MGFAGNPTPLTPLFMLGIPAICADDEEAISGFHISRAEAMSGFNNDTMFIEKFIEHPRHVEVCVWMRCACCWDTLHMGVGSVAITAHTISRHPRSRQHAAVAFS